MNFSDRLQKALYNSKLSQSELARRLNVKPQSVQQWLSGKNFPRHLRVSEIALTLNVAESWLTMGIGPMPDIDSGQHGGNNIKRYKKPPSLPVYSWLDIAKSQDLFDLDHTKYEAIDRPFPCSKNAFSLQICDDSMDPYFCIGEYIVVEPTTDIETPTEGAQHCFVVARAYNEPIAVIRQLVQLDEKPYLLATKPCGRIELSKFDDNWVLYGLTIGKIELYYLSGGKQGA